VTNEKQIYSDKIPNLRLWHDATSLAQAEFCPRSYQHRILENWSTHNDNIHLLFGLLYHDGLEHFTLQHHLHKVPYEDALQDTFAFCQRELKKRKWVDDLPEKNDHTLIRSVIWYLLHYQNEAYIPYEYEVGGQKKLAVELTFAIPLEDKHNLLIEDHTIGGHMDGVLVNKNDPEDIWIQERKSTKKTLNTEFPTQNGYDPSTQVFLYSWAGAQILPEPVYGVMLDVTQTTVNFSRFRRYLILKNQEQLAEVERNIRSTIASLEMYAQENYWPQHTRNCWSCPFKKVCSEPESVRKSILNKNFVQSVWNPAEVRS